MWHSADTSATVEERAAATAELEKLPPIHAFCALDDATYTQWKRALGPPPLLSLVDESPAVHEDLDGDGNSGGMRLANTEQLALLSLPMLVGPWSSRLLPGRSSSPRRPQQGQHEQMQDEAPVTSARRLQAQDFDVMRHLGSGGFAKVMLVRRRTPGTQDAMGAIRELSPLLAMKVMKKEHIVRHRQERHINEELRVLSSIVHPFIIRLECAFSSATMLYLVPTLCRSINFRACTRFDLTSNFDF